MTEGERGRKGRRKVRKKEGINERKNERKEERNPWCVGNVSKVQRSTHPVREVSVEFLYHVACEDSTQENN